MLHQHHVNGNVYRLELSSTQIVNNLVGDTLKKFGRQPFVWLLDNSIVYHTIYPAGDLGTAQDKKIVGGHILPLDVFQVMTAAIQSCPATRRTKLIQSQKHGVINDMVTGKADEAKHPIRMSAASALLFGMGAVAIVQWWQIAYRLYLFLNQDGGKFGVNHIGDGDFSLVYTCDALLLLSAIYCWSAFHHSGAKWRRLVLFVGMANLVGWLTLVAMHRTGVLVEYHEFIRNMRHEHTSPMP